jgi:regulatory protein
MKPCFDYALHYINRFPKTEYELRLQLRKKWYYEDEIDTTLDMIKELNYVNDREFTRLYFGSECERKWKPLFKVKGKLMHKGVEKDLIEEVEEELREEITAWQKKKINKEMEILKWKWFDGIEIIQKLQGRGYHFELIKETIEER